MAAGGEKEWVGVLPCMCIQRDYSRKGLPLLTVESEANGDSKSTYDKALYLILLLDRPDLNQILDQTF